MSLFDLLFLAAVAASLFCWVAAALAALRRRAVAIRILKAWSVCAALYFAAVILTSAVLPRRVLAMGEARCSDDWCVTVEKAARNGGTLTVSLRLESRARRVTQRERDMVVYVSDDRGRRYDPLPDTAEVPLDVQLGPGESVTAQRVFRVPPQARGLGVVVGHEGGFPIGWFIIGYDTWFRKPAIVPLP